MRNEFDHEKDNMRQHFDDEKREFERRIRDIEDKLRRTSESLVQSGGDTVTQETTFVTKPGGGGDMRHKFEMEKADIERKYIMEKTNSQQEFDRLIQQVNVFLYVFMDYIYCVEEHNCMNDHSHI